MGEHTISLRVSGGGVLALENPLTAFPGDTVTWLFDASTVGKDVRVVFREVELADGSGKEPCGDAGPFSELSRSADRIVGAVSSAGPKGRFIYDILEGEVKLDWHNPLPPGQNFGGLDIPPPPPRGGAL